MNRNLIAILRGIQPSEVESITDTLIESGIKQIEVPLNSPMPLKSIELMVDRFASVARIGAGTVLTAEQVQSVRDVGGQFIVSPNFDAEVVKATKLAAMQSFPGVISSTECFAALKAGADGLKFFPADQISPAVIRALRAVLPAGVPAYMVGGVKPADFSRWLAAGASGFGLGSMLYKPGDTVSDVSKAAQLIVSAFDQAQQS